MNSTPCEQYAKVQTQSRVRIEQDGTTGSDDLLQWPRPAPIEEPGCELDGVERCRHVTNDPEDQPQGSPRLTDDHRDVLGCKAKRKHAQEVEHPVDWKRAFAKGVGVLSNSDVVVREVVAEWNLESEADKRVSK